MCVNFVHVTNSARCGGKCIKQVVSVISHMATLKPHTDRSVLFTTWRQCPFPSNTWFLGAKLSLPPRSISILQPLCTVQHTPWDMWCLATAVSMRCHQKIVCPLIAKDWLWFMKVTNWLPSVGFRSWSRFLAVSLQVTWVINPAVGCHYFLPGL